MARPPYGDEGYGPVPDSNDPGVPSENEARPGAGGDHGHVGPGNEPPHRDPDWTRPSSNAPAAHRNPGRDQEQWGVNAQAGHRGGHAEAGGAGHDGQPGQPRAMAGQGAGGKSPKTLFIIGGVVLLVLVVLAALVFFVFGYFEKRDRRAVVNAANEVVETIRDNDKYSDLNDLLCPGYQTDEEVANQIDERMAASGLYLDDIFGQPGQFDEVVVTEEDVEFASDERRSATVMMNFDYGQDMFLRKIDGDWMFCQGDVSNRGVDDFPWPR